MASTKAKAWAPHAKVPLSLARDPLSTRYSDVPPWILSLRFGRGEDFHERAVARLREQLVAVAGKLIGESDSFDRYQSLKQQGQEMVAEMNRLAAQIAGARERRREDLAEKRFTSLMERDEELARDLSRQEKLGALLVGDLRPVLEALASAASAELHATLTRFLQGMRGQAQARLASALAAIPAELLDEVADAQMELSLLTSYGWLDDTLRTAGLIPDPATDLPRPVRQPPTVHAQALSTRDLPQGPY